MLKSDLGGEKVKTYRFVRHAQGQNDARNRRSQSNTPLSELGWWQAEAVAARLSSCGAQGVVVGTMTRAFDTAWIINGRLPRGLWNNVIYVNGLFNRYDAETFAEQRDRARRAIEHLEQRPEDNLIVVTHGEPLRMMLALMMFGDDLTDHRAAAASETLRLPHTGVSKFTYDASAARPWRLISWGEHDHLTGRLLSF